MSWPFARVLLVRHGESEWNRLGRRQGQLDSPLTAAGRRHARTLAALVKPTDVDTIYSSPLGRAHATASLIAQQVGARVHVLDGLAEVHHGTFAGLTPEDLEARYPGAMTTRATAKYTWRFPGGESYEDADGRATLALAQVATSGTRSPLLVTHEMIARMLRRNLLGLTPDEALTWSLPHATLVEFSEQRGSIIETMTVAAPLDGP